MITKKAIEKLRADESEAPQIVIPDLASLQYRTDSTEHISKTTAGRLGKAFPNRFVTFGNFSERARNIYLTMHSRFVDLKAGLDEICDEDLIAELEARAYIFAQTTMSKDGFTTKELTTQRVYEAARPQREAVGFWGRLLGRGARKPEEEEI